MKAASKPVPALLLVLLMAAPAATVGAALVESPTLPAQRGTPADNTGSSTQTALEHARRVVDQVISESYPELGDARIQIRSMGSRSDYFRARVGIPQFLFSRMRFLVLVNPQVFDRGAPEEAIRAIIAHELAHILYYKGRNRLALLGLFRLASRRFTASFERRADLEAISRGYGSGLKLYRQWLYENVRAHKLNEKLRNYYSPLEIDAISMVLQRHPEAIKDWMRNPPTGTEAILSYKPRER